MLVPEFVKALKSPEDRLAWLVAITADTIQSLCSLFLWLVVFHQPTPSSM